MIVLSTEVTGPQFDTKTDLSLMKLLLRVPIDNYSEKQKARNVRSEQKNH